MASNLVAMASNLRVLATRDTASNLLERLLPAGVKCRPALQTKRLPMELVAVTKSGAVPYNNLYVVCKDLSDLAPDKKTNKRKKENLSTKSPTSTEPLDPRKHRRTHPQPSTRALEAPSHLDAFSSLGGRPLPTAAPGCPCGWRFHLRWTRPRREGRDGVGGVGKHQELQKQLFAGSRLRDGFVCCREVQSVWYHRRTLETLCVLKMVEGLLISLVAFLLLVVRPAAPSSVLAPSSKARSP